MWPRPAKRGDFMSHPEFYKRIFGYCNAVCLISLPAQYSNLLLARAPSAPLCGAEGARATVLFCGCDGVGMRRSAFPRHRSHRVKLRKSCNSQDLRGNCLENREVEQIGKADDRVVGLHS